MLSRVSLFFLCLLTITSVAIADEIRVDIPVFAGGEGSAFFLDAARQYEALKPGVKIDLVPDPRIADQVQVRILSGTVPDATNASLDYRRLIAAGKIQPLDAFLDKPSWDGDTTWRQSFLPGTLDLYTVDHHVYGIPFCYFVNVVWFNKAMFADHGWTPPKTWNQLFSLCDKIKAAGIAPMAFQGRYPYYAEPFYAAGVYHSAGNDALLAQRSPVPGSFSSAAAIHSFGLTQRLAEQYFQPGSAGMSHTESQLQFFLGHTAMIPCGSWLRSEMKGKIPCGFKLGCFNMPLPDQGTVADPTALNVFSNDYFVFAQGKHPEVAVDFFRFMTSRKIAGSFSRQQDLPTAIRGANEGNLSGDLDDLVALMREAKSSYGIDPGAKFPAAVEMQKSWDAVLGRLIAPGSTLTPQQAAAQVECAAAQVANRWLHPQRVLPRHVTETIVFLSLLVAAGTYLSIRVARSIFTYSKREVTESLPRLGGRNVLLFVGPATIIYSVFVVWPCLRSFVWSTHEWDGISPAASMSFVGLLNFKRLLLESDAFWIALKNNLFLMVAVPLFVIPLSLFLAACISRGVRGSAFFRVVFFFPNLLGSVAVALLWMQLYNPQGGLINAGLNAIGLGTIFNGFAWLAADHLYWALIPLSVWAACGFNMVLFLAAMQNVPASLYEAADLDGATPWRQFWHITVPMIWEALTIAAVFLVLGGMKAFEIIWLLTNQRPSEQSNVVSTRMVQAMFSEFQIGEATAIAVLLFLVVFTGTAVTLGTMKRDTVEI